MTCHMIINLYVPVFIWADLSSSSGWSLSHFSQKKTPACSHNGRKMGVNLISIGSVVVNALSKVHMLQAHIASLTSQVGNLLDALLLREPH